MGMAASQARFLQLTARKTNIEYMGQQINQQRLSLANQSAGLFEKMLTMEPPTPPSSLDDQYYSQGYTFTDPGDSVAKKVSWQTMDEVIEAGVLADGTGVTAASSAMDVGFVLHTAAAYPGDLTAPDGVVEGTYTGIGDGAVWVDSGDTTAIVTTGSIAGGVSTEGSVSAYTYQDLADMDTQAEVDTFMSDWGIEASEGATKQVIRFVTVEHNIYDPDGNYQTIQEQTPALLEFDNLERLVNMVLLNDAGATGQDSTVLGTAATVSVVRGTGTATDTVNGDTLLNGADTYANDYYAAYRAGANGTAANVDAVTYSNFTSTGFENLSSATIGSGESLTYSAVFDDQAFNDDMNKYEFAKAAYDYEIERINLETAQIQKQDKSLELKLKQLDTERTAIQTEMDAVQKVLQKNIESSFKTFS